MQNPDETEDQEPETDQPQVEEEPVESEEKPESESQSAAGDEPGAEAAADPVEEYFDNLAQHAKKYGMSPAQVVAGAYRSTFGDATPKPKPEKKAQVPFEGREDDEFLTVGEVRAMIARNEKQTLESRVSAFCASRGITKPIQVRAVVQATQEYMAHGSGYPPEEIAAEVLKEMFPSAESKGDESEGVRDKVSRAGQRARVGGFGGSRSAGPQTRKLRAEDLPYGSDEWWAAAKKEV